ncbi:MAG: TIGR04283 family arsenosugar biosynthesis glycosyltransferase [Gelidibacter sp.]
MNNQVSIIIPILNEAETIGKLIQHLLDNSSAQNVSEIIVVDGGSVDGSQKAVEGFVTSSDSDVSEFYREEGKTALDTKFSIENFTRTDIKLLISQKGRAKQMNLGAKHATGNILYFLHADSFPPKDFDQLIVDEVKKGNAAGCFRMQFDSNHWWLRLASWLTQFRWRACRGGDQSQFITQKLFDDIGGFDESYIVYEDNILINELFARKQFVVINKKLKTSARLYQKHGVWKLQYHFWTIYVKKWFGASAENLHNYYTKHIA